MDGRRANGSPTFRRNNGQPPPDSTRGPIRGHACMAKYFIHLISLNSPPFSNRNNRKQCWLHSRSKSLWIRRSRTKHSRNRTTRSCPLSDSLFHRDALPLRPLLTSKSLAVFYHSPNDVKRPISVGIAPVKSLSEISNSDSIVSLPI